MGMFQLYTCADILFCDEEEQKNNDNYYNDPEPATMSAIKAHIGTPLFLFVTFVYNTE